MQIDRGAFLSLGCCGPMRRLNWKEERTKFDKLIDSNRSTKIS